MQRWHLTAGLAVTAGLTALLAPQLQARTARPDLTPPLAPVAPELIGESVVEPQSLDQGKLHITAGLDHPAVYEGQFEERLLVITVRADEIEGAVERPVHVAVVMDRSGSMNRSGKLDYAKEAANQLIQGLDGGDTFSFVTFSDRAQVVVPSSAVSSPYELMRSVERVTPGGGTNLYEGIRTGLTQVSPYAGDGSVDRVIVLSDGRANVGITDPTSLARLSGSFTDQTVSVSTIGLGLDYNEDLLARMADVGGGTYRFVDDASSLASVFQEELHQLNAVAASGVQVDIELPGAELVEVLGYDATQTSDGFSVRLGDVYGGQTRKIVAKVRIRGQGADTRHAVASVRLHEAGEVAAYAPVGVDAMVTRNREVVARSVNRKLAVMGKKAEASSLATKAAQAYEQGDVQGSADLLDASRLVAAETSSRYGAEDEMAPMAKALDDQKSQYTSFDDDSVEGRRAIKQNKEANRGWSR